ncbi:hypothetical protein WMY93_032297 [Mugilogobius chulae]|uniref:Uncharacterized protein n=1 Tax=Mugilogobius chulae TaxID=88201 RepID=A0AAW0MW05_9GOBI
MSDAEETKSQVSAPLELESPPADGNRRRVVCGHVSVLSTGNSDQTQRVVADAGGTQILSFLINSSSRGKPDFPAGFPPKARKGAESPEGAAGVSGSGLARVSGAGDRRRRAQDPTGAAGGAVAVTTAERGGDQRQRRSLDQSQREEREGQRGGARANGRSHRRLSTRPVIRRQLHSRKLTPPRLSQKHFGPV